MALDYNHKKQVNRNRPRKRPVKFLLLLILGSFFSVYGLGIATGWLIFKYLPQNTPSTSDGSTKPDGTDQAVTPSPAPTTPKGGAASLDKEPDLTFYYTLPKGEKGVIGSGINTLPPQTAPKNTASVSSQTQNIKPPQPQLDDKMEISKPAAQKEKSDATSGVVQPTPLKKDSDKTTYTIQVAAYHEKSDAQELKAKLQKIGISARIEEYTVAGKGIWYRVRTGSKLDKESANKLAAKIGTNAILVTE